MDKIYVLIRDAGEWDDYFEQVIAFDTDREKLEAHARKLQEQVEHTKAHMEYIEDTGVEEPDTNSDEAWDKYSREHEAAIYARCKSLGIDPDVYDALAMFWRVGYSVKEVERCTY